MMKIETNIIHETGLSIPVYLENKNGEVYFKSDNIKAKSPVMFSGTKEEADAFIAGILKATMLADNEFNEIETKINMNNIIISSQIEDLIVFEEGTFKDWINELCSPYSVNKYNEERYIGICLKDIQLTGSYKLWNYYYDLTSESRAVIMKAIKEYYHQHKIRSIGA